MTVSNTNVNRGDVMISNTNCGVYLIKNMLTRKVYVGSSVNIKTRWYRHRRALRNKTHANKYLQRAWNKYGENNFIFGVLEYCDSTERISKEQEFISKFNSMSTKYGYNQIEAGPGITGFKHSEETRKNMSKTRKGKPGCNHSEETKKFLSACHSGTTHSNETRKKMSEAQKKRWRKTDDRTQSEEHRRKNSEAQKGKSLPLEVREKISEGHKGSKLSEKTKKKMSEAQKKRWSKVDNKTKSEEHKRKISDACKGKTVSLETRKKMSEAQKRRREKQKETIGEEFS